MRAQNVPFADVIKGNKQFIIPVFQREYAWTERQCEQLWRDIVRVGTSTDARRHFIGSVVYTHDAHSTMAFPRYLIIDGQQRVTTLMLLLAALRDCLRASESTVGDDVGWRTIERVFLKNQGEEALEKQYRLRLRRGDDDVLRSVLDHKPMESKDSLVDDNYRFFRERLTAENAPVVYRGIERLEAVDIPLEPGRDDPQLVFESMNSTGLELSHLDLIRNFVLMGRSDSEQTRLYECYWQHIDRLFRDNSQAFDAFIRDYMVLHTGQTGWIREDDLYFEFRELLRHDEAARTIDGALASLLRYARISAAFLLCKEAPADLAAQLSRLAGLNRVVNILVLKLWVAAEDQGGAWQPVVGRALALIESYLFRRAVCALQSRSYWQIVREVALRLDESAPLDSLKARLALQGEANRFPSDVEFERQLLDRDIYRFGNCHYCLERLENHDTKEPSPTDTYSIEHVLPQNDDLCAEWRESLGPDWKAVQQVWVHRLGNLTFTAYNSEMKDKPFERKKTTKGGFNDSAVRLNAFLRTRLAWTSDDCPASTTIHHRRQLELTIA
ncbi:MAG: DUF262 domain-containing protein, partial [Myxococcota bacterium]